MPPEHGKWKCVPVKPLLKSLAPAHPAAVAAAAVVHAEIPAPARWMLLVTCFAAPAPAAAGAPPAQCVRACENKALGALILPEKVQHAIMLPHRELKPALLCNALSFQRKCKVCKYAAALKIQACPPLQCNHMYIAYYKMCNMQ
eukprot:1147355-Pelagomonas_calceolata.AAC.6